jgi:phospholipid transport system substrate-binding protein
MSRVERPGKDPVRLDFRVRDAGETWLIIDIYGKGKVSEVALRRSEYAAILERTGIEGLIQSVDELSEKTASK